MPKAIEADWELVKALFFQGFTAGQIALRTGIKPGTVQTRAARMGWCKLRDRGATEWVNPGLATLANTQSKALSKASLQSQSVFSEELASQANLLHRTPPKRLSDLANTPKREGRASVVSRLVHTAAKLYGWDNQSNSPTHVSLTKIDVRPASATPQGPVVDVPYE